MQRLCVSLFKHVLAARAACMSDDAGLFIVGAALFCAAAKKAQHHRQRTQRSCLFVCTRFGCARCVHVRMLLQHLVHICVHQDHNSIPACSAHVYLCACWRATCMCGSCRRVARSQHHNSIPHARGAHVCCCGNSVCCARCVPCADDIVVCTCDGPHVEPCMLAVLVCASVFGCARSVHVGMMLPVPHMFARKHVGCWRCVHVQMLLQSSVNLCIHQDHNIIPTQRSCLSVCKPSLLFYSPTHPPRTPAVGVLHALLLFYSSAAASRQPHLLMHACMLTPLAARHHPPRSYACPVPARSHARALVPLLLLLLARCSGDATADVRLLDGNHLVLATPQQWDMLSRRWKQRKAVQAVSLFIADELHLLGGQQGPVLEVRAACLQWRLLHACMCVEHAAVLHCCSAGCCCCFGTRLPALPLWPPLCPQVICSRMRYMSSQLPQPLRIVGLSHSLANARDVGEWLGASPQSTFNFPPGVRPVPLEVHMHGFDIHNFEARMQVRRVQELSC